MPRDEGERLIDEKQSVSEEQLSELKSANDSLRAEVRELRALIADLYARKSDRPTKAKAILEGKSIEPCEVRFTLELMGVAAGTAFTVDALLGLV